MKRIFLIGFMGSGKSHTGHLLARRLALPFIDLDDRIEELAGMTIAGIFERDGEEVFRQLEARALRSCEASGAAVIACGGGTPCFYDNIHWMNEHGLTIYLQASPRLLAHRLLAGLAHRPLLRGKSPEQLEEYIRMKVVEREPFYLQAGIVYHQETGDEPVVDELVDHLLEITGH